MLLALVHSAHYTWTDAYSTTSLGMGSKHPQQFTFIQKYFDFKTKYLKFADKIIGLTE